MYKMQIESNFPSKKLVGVITRNTQSIWNRKNKILISNIYRKKPFAYLGLLSSTHYDTSGIYNLNEEYCNKFDEGDIISIDINGVVKTLWKKTSKHNAIFVTPSCNCCCLMCPQPPEPDHNFLQTENIQLIDLIPSDYREEICFTGGEPTLFKNKFIDLLSKCHDRFPFSPIIILTNGINLRDFEFTKKIVNIGHEKLIFAISLQADTPQIHDNITQSINGFSDTIAGIHNLVRFRQNIELRFVITMKNYQRLDEYALFIYKNFPFVLHVAFMGLEMTGFADKNKEIIFIEPFQYVEKLRDAIIILKQRNINCSIYNIPLCLLPKELWATSKQSISDWKNDFADECKGCKVFSKCCGQFTTSDEVFYKNIKKIT